MGLNSPFVEFKTTSEILSNVSISLNSTDGNEGMANNMMTTNTFSYAFEAIGNHTVQKQYLDMVKSQQRWTQAPTTKNATKPTTITQNRREPTLAQMDRDKDAVRHDFADSVKVIVPQALKSGTKPSTTTTSTTSMKPPVLPDSSPNIDDLKRHILMLQSLTKNDESFQSKFVVFPHLQRPGLDSTDVPSSTTTTSTTTTTPAPTTHRSAVINTISTTSRRATVPTTRVPDASKPAKPLATLTKEESHKAEKITIVSAATHCPFLCCAGRVSAVVLHLGLFEQSMQFNVN